MTINGSWGYHETDPNHKSTKTLINCLIGAAANGGNYLLNIGPDQLGNVATADSERLTQMGHWVDKYGESIYGTTKSVFKTLLPSGVYSTTKDGAVYLQVTNWPSDGKIVVPRLNNTVESVELMESSEQISYTMNEAQMIIQAPTQGVDPYASVIKIKVSGTPSEYQAEKTNLALNKPVTVSSVDTSDAKYAAENLTDGKLDTYWQSGILREKNWFGHEEYVDVECTAEIDFGEPTTFNQVAISEHDHRIKSFTIDYWNGSEWVTGQEWHIAGAGFIGENLGSDLRTFYMKQGTVTATKIRLHVVKAIAPSIPIQLMVNEIQVYNVPAPVTITSPTSNDWFGSLDFSVTGTADEAVKTVDVYYADKIVPATVEDDGTWSVQLSGKVSLGYHAVRAQGKDANGNAVYMASSFPNYMFDDITAEDNTRLTSIKADDKALSGWESYDKPSAIRAVSTPAAVMLSYGAAIPTITAKAESDLSTVEVTQASSVPGVASIKVTSQSGQVVTYKVYIDQGLEVNFGDVNNDNKINSFDLLLTRMDIADKKKLTDPQFVRADFNVDRQITSAEYENIMKIIDKQN